MSRNPNVLTDAETALMARTVANLDNIQRMFGQKRFDRNASFRLAIDVARATIVEWLENCGTTSQRDTKEPAP